MKNKTRTIKGVLIPGGCQVTINRDKFIDVSIESKIPVILALHLYAKIMEKLPDIIDVIK